MTLELEVQGFDEALEWIQDIDVPGRLGVAVGRTVEALARFAASITPVDTGSMRDAWRSGTGRVYVDGSAVNRRSGVPVASYAEVVSDRMGIMDAVGDMAMRVGVTELEEAFGGV